MTEDQTPNEEAGKAPSEPDHDPKQHPAPPGNPEIDRDALEKSEEKLDQVSGR